MSERLASDIPFPAGVAEMKGVKRREDLQGPTFSAKPCPGLKMANPVTETKRDDVDEALDRRSRILDGARSAFMRFGFERSSIADIATGAGVSRTAVYHYFPGKEDVLGAVVEEFNAGILKAADEALEHSGNLREALIGLLEAKFGSLLTLMSASPHGAELVDATHRLTGPATRTADGAFHALVVEALVRYGSPEEADATADTLIAAAKGLMQPAEVPVTRVKFDDRIGRLVAWLID